HMQTLTGSVQLLSAELGTVFLPVIEDVIDFLQDLARWFEDLDPATKETISTWIRWGAVLLGVVVAGKAVAYVFGLVQGLLAPLTVAVTLATGGFAGLGVKVKEATTALLAFAAANRVTMILAVGTALAALTGALGLFRDESDDAIRRIE